MAKKRNRFLRLLGTCRVLTSVMASAHRLECLTVVLPAFDLPCAMVEATGALDDGT